MRWGDRIVGSATLRPWGLYYEVCCQCEKIEQDLVELIGQGVAFQENFGLLLPAGEKLHLKTQIPAKRIPTEDIHFFLRPRQNAREDLVPIEKEKPFAYLQCLDRAYFVRQGENAMVGFRKK